MVTKDEAARTLARKLFDTDEGITHLYRLIGAAEDDSAEPIKLLEAAEYYEPFGFLPLGFKPMPALGIPYHHIIMAVSPGELVDIQGGRLELPRGWRLGEELCGPGTERPPIDDEEWVEEEEPV
jgi:hypothetical protein